MQLSGRGQDRLLTHRAAGVASCRQELPSHAMAFWPAARQLEAPGQEIMARLVFWARL
jgi:hypothetical protein